MCRSTRLSFNRLSYTFRKNTCSSFGKQVDKKDRRIGPTQYFRILGSKFTLIRLRYKWPFGISATMSYINDERTNTAMTTGNYDPRCLPVRILFLLLYSLLPLLALAKASQPTNKYVRSGRAALKDTFCPGVLMNFFFRTLIG